MKDKIKISQIILVEGKYDKIKLSSIVDAYIITTDGFQIYGNKEKINVIKKLGNRYGVIILTDSDVAGFKIRNFISSFLPKSKIINIYIPQINGKEKRKHRPSKENMLGVEGVDREVILKCFERAGIIKNSDAKNLFNSKRKISKLDFYNDGLTGFNNSKEKRDIIKKHLELPIYMSTNALLESINRLITYDEYKSLVKKINSKY